MIHIPDINFKLPNNIVKIIKPSILNINTSLCKRFTKMSHKYYWTGKNTSGARHRVR